MFDANCGPAVYMLEMSGAERNKLKIITILPTISGVIRWNIWVIHKIRTEMGVEPSLFILLNLFKSLNLGRRDVSESQNGLYMPVVSLGKSG
jgi:hypothetical protein